MTAITLLEKGPDPMPTLPHANGVYIDRDVLRLDHTFGPPVRRRRRRARQARGPVTAIALWAAGCLGALFRRWRSARP